jgi:predicted hydrocarbon binding protein
VEFSITLVNTIGALSEVASVLAKHRVNVTSGYHNANEWCFFADITKMDSTLEHIVKEVSSLAVVKLVITGEKASDGLIIDSIHKAIKLGSREYLMLRADSIRAFLQSVKGIFGPQGKVGNVLVFNMGSAAGKQAYNEATAVLGIEYLKTHLQTLMDAYMAQGVGEYKLLNLDVDHGKASVQVSNNFECMHLSGKDSPQSDLARGYLAGLFSEYLGRRVDVTETRCVACGHSTCLFEITPATP